MSRIPLDLHRTSKFLRLRFFPRSLNLPLEYRDDFRAKNDNERTKGFPRTKSFCVVQLNKRILSFTALRADFYLSEILIRSLITETFNIAYYKNVRCIVATPLQECVFLRKSILASVEESIVKIKLVSSRNGLRKFKCDLRTSACLRAIAISPISSDGEYLRVTLSRWSGNKTWRRYTPSTRLIKQTKI